LKTFIIENDGIRENCSDSITVYREVVNAGRTVIGWTVEEMSQNIAFYVWRKFPQGDMCEK
jgi:hypothetical protein